MKILYLSCHSILEYDELKLFEEMGIEYFSLGSYINPRKPVDQIRPALKTEPRSYWLDRAPDRNKLTAEYVADFDAIIIMHLPEWIFNNWDVIKHKRVIWRTIGQSTPALEKKLFSYRMEGLQIVRYSPREQYIAENIGFDRVIRFYKDPEEFRGYNGLNREVITFNQNIKTRAEFCNFDTWDKVTQGLPAKVYGPNNENVGERNGGFLTYPEMQQKMRDSRVYFYVGTQPASYTLNFIEAMMSGIPIVAIGPKLANSLNIAGDVYEIPDIIQNGFNGYVSDDPEELKAYIIKLLDNPKLAKQMGELGRQRAVELFGKDKIKQQWKEFLENDNN